MYTYLNNAECGPFFLATVTVSLFLVVVTCLGGGKTGELVSVSESSVKHGNQLTCGCWTASSCEALAGTILSLTLGFLRWSTMLHVQVRLS